MEIVLPASYSVIEEEEMMYLDGGISFSRSWVAVPVDVIALSICWYLALIKFMGKQAAAALVKKYLPKLSGVIAKAAKSVLGVSINVSSGAIGSKILGNAWCLTSLGGIVCLGLDWATDGKINNRIVI